MAGWLGSWVAGRCSGRSPDRGAVSLSCVRRKATAGRLCDTDACSSRHRSGSTATAGDFHIDPWGAAPRALITHAHGDHARSGSAAYLCAAPGAALLRRRVGAGTAIEALPYGQPLTLGGVTVSFHPAGHVLGSAQIRIEGSEGVWVVSGDYKRAPDPTCAPFEPVRCDVFVTESTFALPIYRWDPTATVIGRPARAGGTANRARGLDVDRLLLHDRQGAAAARRARAADRPAGAGARHDAAERSRSIAAAGVRMLPTQPLVERPRGTSLAGELVLAPPSARGTPWMRRLGDLSDALASGLMRVRGVRRQRAYDRGFVLSDHADWPAVLDTIADTGAGRVLATHGHAETPCALSAASRASRLASLRTAWEGEAGADDHE